MRHQPGLSPAAPASRETPASPPTIGRYWRLGDHITACLATDRILFLDVRRDRYFALSAAENGGFVDFLRQSDGGALPEPYRAMLVNYRIIDANTAESLSATPRTVTRPSGVDSEWSPRTPVHPRLLFGVGKAVFSASREIQARPLEVVLRRRLQEDRPEVAVPNRADRVAQFNTVRPYIPVPRVCLHDCLALVAWLGGTRGGVQLVFGVSAHPFAAHCWVQADGLVLDDHPDSPSRFQPILHFP